MWLLGKWEGHTWLGWRWRLIYANQTLHMSFSIKQKSAEYVQCAVFYLDKVSPSRMEVNSITLSSVYHNADWSSGTRCGRHIRVPSKWFCGYRLRRGDTTRICKPKTTGIRPALFESQAVCIYTICLQQLVWKDYM